MSNLPQRVHTKKSIKVVIDNKLYSSTRKLAVRAGCSMSSITESILLLSKLIYFQEMDDAFIYELRDIKIRRLSSLSDLRMGLPSTRCHLTVDPEAVDFAHMLRKAYRPVFESAQEVIALCLSWALENCKTEAELTRFLRRLENAQLMFPKHKKGTP